MRTPWAASSAASLPAQQSSITCAAAAAGRSTRHVMPLASCGELCGSRLVASWSRTTAAAAATSAALPDSHTDGHELQVCLRA